MRFKRITAIASAVAVLGTVFATLPINAAALDGDFTIASAGGASSVYIDSTGADYDGLSIIADTFAGDVELVSGQKPDVKTASDAEGISGAVIAGVVGDELITSTGIDTSDIEGKNETYKIEVIGGNLVIAGSDKRGAIYGIFHVSEEHMGVSPWVYWADAKPEHKDTVSFTPCVGGEVSKEPSVTYRGIFLNDEAPNLTGWTDGQFGQHFGPQFYGKVFELILRLKGNYLWPAMWSNDFYKEGNRGNSDLAAYKTAMALTEGALANAELADKYGVFMGTSHHEPIGRAGNEWAEERNNYLGTHYPEAVGKSSEATWDYFTYPDALDEFWTDSYARSASYENVVTIGMRGEADSDLGYSLEDSITNLENVITSQFNIMDTYNSENNIANRPPTVLALYKEVEDFWLGRQTKSGITETSDKPLRDWTVDGETPLKDTIILLTNDNFGNVRTLPESSERDTYGGWGMYYHFDYNGGPRSYRWVSSVQLEKIWQNMTDCYEYGVDDMWIVNVGDLKPHEMEISYFLDLAYDYDAWNDVNKIDEYTKAWTVQQFGYDEVSDAVINEIADIQSDYLKLNATRRAEVVFPVTYSLTDSNELYDVIARAEDIYNKAVGLEKDIPVDLKDAYYQLVEYPAAASANVTLTNAYSKLNNMFALSSSLLANKYAQLVNDCIEIDTAMQDRYNKDIAGGKWNGMQSNAGLGHFDATNWNLTDWSYPGASFVKPAEGSVLIVHADGTKTGAKAGGELALPTYTSTNKEAYALTVSNGGKAKLDYTATASDSWIKLSKSSGSVYSGEVIEVTVDWSLLTQTSTGTITVSSGDQTVTVDVTAEVIDVTGISGGTFVGKDGVISIEAEHFADASGMMVVNNLGKNLSTIKTQSYTESGIEVCEPVVIDNTAKIAVKNTTAKAAAFNVYLAEYNEDNTLKGVKSITKASAEAGADTEVLVPDLPEDNYRLFIWDDNMSPYTVGTKDGAYAAYKVYAPVAGTYTLTAITGSSNPRTTSDMLSYYIKVNDGSAAEQTSITSAFVAGDSGNPEWCNGVMHNAHISSQNVTLAQGENTITFYPSNSAVVLQKLVIKEGADDPYVQRDGVKDTGNEFIGPSESYRVGGEGEQMTLVHSIVDDEMNIPGVVDKNGTVIVPETGTYQIIAENETGDITLTLNDQNTVITKNTDGYEVELTAGEYELTFTGADSLEFVLLNLVPGIIINHPMSTQTEVDAAAAGYVNLHDADSQGNEIPRAVSFDNGAMKYETTGKYSTSGFKYDITSVVKRVIAEYGEDTEFKLSMDIKSVIGANGTPRIGFMSDSGDIAAAEITELVNGSEFTTVTCKSTLTDQDKVYLFLYAGEPVSYVKNIKVTYPVPVKTDLFTHTSGSDWTDYEVYDSTNTEAELNKSGDYMTASFGSHGWDSNNGVRLDVTDHVHQCDNGGLFGITITFGTFSWNSNNMKAYLEYEDGTNKVELASGVSDGATDYTITGENNYTYDIGKNVYLCITHPSGTQYYHDITFWGYKTDGDDEPEPVQQKTTVFKHTFSSADKTAQTALYEPYETEGGTVAPANGTAMKYTNGTASVKGIKINVTDMLKENMSGLTFGASAYVKSGYSASGSANIFFEVNGQRVDLGTIAFSGNVGSRTDDSGSDLGNNWLTTPVSGESALTYSEGDLVYLCITAPENEQWYDDITLYYYPDGEEEPTEPSADELITLFGGIGTTGWEIYDADNTAAHIDSYGSDKFGASFENNWKDNNGIKIDVTELLNNAKNGGRFEVMYNLATYAWSSSNGINMPSVFFETESGAKTQLTVSLPDAGGSLESGESTAVVAAGIFDIPDSETVYLCLTHGAGYQSYNSIIFKGTAK